MAFTLTSPAFGPGAAIPVRYTCDGEGLCPELTWHDAPSGVRSFAIVMDDPDAPSGTFTHWLLCDMPPTATAVPEAARADQLGTPGTNGFGKVGYGGPCPPRGDRPHRYRFRIYALDRRLDLPHGFARRLLDAGLTAGALASAELTGSYGRGRT
ncbi:MAG: YbhB/YbcL family Raf kinase inhibitor-like protein [Vicinamibacterales bacterium]